MCKKCRLVDDMERMKKADTRVLTADSPPFDPEICAIKCLNKPKN
jgi:hypothetical protein